MSNNISLITNEDSVTNTEYIQLFDRGRPVARIPATFDLKDVPEIYHESIILSISRSRSIYLSLPREEEEEETGTRTITVEEQIRKERLWAILKTLGLLLASALGFFGADYFLP